MTKPTGKNRVNGVASNIVDLAYGRRLRIWALPLSMPEKLVLLRFSATADNAGRGHIHIDTIKRDCDLCDQEALQAINTLLDYSLIEAWEDGTGREGFQINV